MDYVVRTPGSGVLDNILYSQTEQVSGSLSTIQSYFHVVVYRPVGNPWLGSWGGGGGSGG